ncbi:uncharacterized protein il11b [Paramisgurnus dabryanus]|uniref:uncharacterized protein il11b n=1 Tax=Paramisgurnus dabryanus TaxID=90735 RepID=UPI0031F3BFBC
MRLLPESTLPLIFLMTWTELFPFTVGRPVSSSQGREGLQRLQDEMRMLSTLLTEKMDMSEMMEDFERDLTSLPTLRFTAQDLKSLEVSRTLADLHSGLTSFLFHLDWLMQKQEELGMDSSKTQKIIHRIKSISRKVLKEIGSAPPEFVHPTLPTINTSWRMYQTTMEIQKKLYLFCDWYRRALGVLKHRR